jgi:hypothetical protein
VARELCLCGAWEPVSSWEQIVAAVRMLQWENLNWLQLRIRPDWFLTITGGGGQFNVYLNAPGRTETSLVNPSSSPGAVPIEIEGQTSWLPNRLLVDEFTVLCAAERFALDGGLVEDLLWEEPKAMRTNTSGEVQTIVGVDEAADRLRQLLTADGFDAARPDPGVAWAVFKRFAAEPVDVQTTELWFEASDGDPARQFPAYFDFVRMFLHYPDDGAEWREQITAHFTAPPAVRLGLRQETVHAADVTDLAAWFASVEASPAFRAGMGFREWSFEARVGGC